MTLAGRVLALLALATLPMLVSACSMTSNNPQEVLKSTAQRLDEIKAAHVQLEVVLENAAAGQEPRQVGFLLDGPMELVYDTDLPRADVEYTQLVGGNRSGGRFVSDGSEAVAVVDGRTRQLDTAAFDVSEEDDAGLGDKLDVGRWIEEPKLESGPEIDDEKTHRVTGRADAVAIVEDLISIAESVGAGDRIGELQDRDRKQLERAVRSADIEVLTGQEDRLLRRLKLSVELAPPEDVQLSKASVAELETRIVVDLKLSQINEPVEVELPDRR